MSTEKAITQLNQLLSQYFSKKISMEALSLRVNELDTPTTRDHLLREGYFTVALVIDTIHDLSFYKEQEVERRLINVKKYLAEAQTGVDPRYTKISFTYSYETPSFKINAEINPRS